MVDEGGDKKCDVADCGAVVVASSCNGVNGVTNGLENGSVSDGFSGGSWGEGVQTYKRRRTRSCSSETKSVEDGKVSGESESQLADKTIKEKVDSVCVDSFCAKTSIPKMDLHETSKGSDDCPLKKQWRNIVLEHMHKSLGESDTGLRRCLQDALLFHPESGCSTAFKESVHIHENRNKHPSQNGRMLDSKENGAVGHVDVVSSGSLNESDSHTRSELCQRSFLNIILSKSFAQLCNLLCENFQEAKVGSFFDISLIDSRLKDGSYELSPTLFHSDIQQIWSKLEKVGTEMTTLAKCLSDNSRTSYCEMVGGSLPSRLEDSKDEFPARETVLEEAKGEQQIEAYGVYKVCSCRRCGDKADGRDCLVCDSCEEMFHVSCIEPPVKEIPAKSWYCADCSANGIQSSHDNCVVCDRLNASRCPLNIVGDDEEFLEFENDSNGLEGNEFDQLFKGGNSMSHCNICRCEIVSNDKLRACSHPFCPHKFYHLGCLTRKQLVLYGPRWYCPSCICRTCLCDRDDDKIVLCDGCDHAYHIYCMQPPRDTIPRGKWFCKKCDEGIQKIRKAKRAYESAQKNLKTEGENSGGVDLLLNAAKTLNYEASLAAAKR